VAYIQCAKQNLLIADLCPYYCGLHTVRQAKPPDCRSLSSQVWLTYSAPSKTNYLLISVLTSVAYIQCAKQNQLYVDLSPHLCGLHTVRQAKPPDCRSLSSLVWLIYSARSKTNCLLISVLTSVAYIQCA